MIALLVFIGGLTVGSFLNVCIHRVPLGLSLLWPGSSCPHCRQRIPAYHNIPVLSFLILRGRCAYCGRNISVQYPLIEVLTGLMSLLLYLRFGQVMELPFYLVFSWFLIMIAVVDLKTQLIHNKVLLTMAVAAVLLNYVFQVIPWPDAVLGALTGGSVMFLFAWAGKIVFRKEAMGMGDVKFAAVAGLFLGWKVILIALYLGFVLALLAVIVMKLMQKLNRDTRIPLGPFLAGGLMLFVLFGDYLTQLYIALILA